MSQEKRKVTVRIIKEEHVDPALKQQCLQTGLYDVAKKAPFLGSILQCLDITYDHSIPRAGIAFDAHGKKWKMFLHPKWFCESLTQEQRQAVLLHEIYHVLHKHPMRAPFLKINEHRRQLLNIAMDMNINQYIRDLPKGCKQCPSMEEMQSGVECENKKCPGGGIFLEDYFDDDNGKKVPWPTNKPFEFYYHKLLEKYKDSDENDGEGECDCENGTNEENGGQGEGKGCDKCKGKGKGKGKGKPGEFDSHHWDGNGEETEMMDATEELVKRAMQKQSLSYDKLPGHIQELLSDIEARRAELDYRGLILSAIKKHASGFNREYSWSRRSRRFGNKAPGTRNGNLPFLGNYIDTSGSISVQEANDFLEIVDNFLKVGSRKCQLSLWHTDVYRSEVYKYGDRLEREHIQSGGTDLEATMKHIVKTQPDLSIILTDGYYSDVDYDSLLPPNTLFPQVLFIISQDGNENHPLKRLGATIKIPNSNELAKDKDLEN